VKLKILTTPNPVLRKKAKKIKKIDQKIKKLIKEMIDVLQTHDDPKGVGLAAPQVGKSWRIFVLLLDSKPTVFINPVIVKQSSKTLSEVLPKEKLFLEGCLSIPNHYGFVDRSYKITVSYLDETGKKQTKTFQNLNASYIQHEYDHLEGVLFVDKVLKQNNPLYELKKDNEGKEELVPIKF